MARPLGTAIVSPLQPARVRRLDWRIVSLYPIVLTLAFAAAVAFSLVVEESRDPKFTGWAAFWVGFVGISAFFVPPATSIHVVGLFLATRLWGVPPTARLAFIEVAAAALHPLGWYWFSDASRPSGTGYPPLFLPWMLVGPLVVAVLLVIAFGRTPSRHVSNGAP